MDPATGIKTAYTVYEIAKKEGAVRRAVNFFKKRRKILVLGASGAGKTQFVKSLAARISAEIPRENRTQKPVQYLYEVSQTPYAFVDTPGESAHSHQRHPEIVKAMKGQYDGIINVVSYGYHEGDRDPSDAVGKDNLVKPDFLAARRTEEIALLQEWTGLVGTAGTGSWMLTVITKADLWWNERDIVRKHYQSGEYRNALTLVNHLNPMICSYCSLQQAFFNKAPMSGLFGTSEFQKLYADFFRVFGEAVGEAQKG